MAEFVSNAKGNAALTTGIIGTAGVGLGLLSNLLGMNGCGCNGGCSENTAVNRYELDQTSRIAKLESDIALRDANIYNDQKLLELYKYVDGKFAHVEKELCDQKVYNATNIATVNCIAGQVNQLYALTKLVIPNTSVCPGWGNVTVSPATTTTGA
jgi:hypothetical protein